MMSSPVNLSAPVSPKRNDVKKLSGIFATTSPLPMAKSIPTEGFAPGWVWRYFCTNQICESILMAGGIFIFLPQRKCRLSFQPEAI